MDAEVTQLVGAARYERSESRLTYCNGYRERDRDSWPAGTLAAVMSETTSSRA